MFSVFGKVNEELLELSKEEQGNPHKEQFQSNNFKSLLMGLPKDEMFPEAFRSRIQSIAFWGDFIPKLILIFERLQCVKVLSDK